MKRVVKTVNREAVPRKLPKRRSATSSPWAAIRSILVPIDFSGPSDKALGYAVSLAGQFDAKLILLHVVEPFPAPDFDYYPIAMESDKVMGKAKQRLEQVAVKAGVDPEGISKVLVRIGVPYREITDAARTANIDLIVIATHGYTGLAHVFMGSTAERVVRHAKCPVLVVRTPERDSALSTETRCTPLRTKQTTQRKYDPEIPR